ncbi:MAG: class II aldolase/adducin family protein [Proteocatella sp.]
MTGYNKFRYLSDYEAKRTIIEVGKRMYDKGFVASNDGNISCKVGPNTIWTTPTGVSKGFMTPDMLVKMNFDGKVLMGKMKPSSEVKMHIRVYKENPDVMAVTHAHPPVATSFAIAGISLDRAILPEAVVNLGSVPIAHYATPGTQDVPDSIAPYCNTHNAVLLANHGALSWGKDLLEAYHRLESLEYYATVLMYTGRIIGRANELSCNQVEELITIREKLGITSGGTPPCAVSATNTSDVVRTEKPLTSSYAASSGCSVSIKPEQEKSDMIKELTEKITKQVLESLKR